MFFVAERAAGIAQMRVIGACLAFVLTVTADSGGLSGRLRVGLGFVASRAVNPLVFE